ncbi:hypothetical protein GE061_014973 [Apolygus lucorum]|uniref:Uncharacterized protein n=1 Tax=Apolygus lucorum TaxID=248454 RepID=A0A8S9XLV3_APOLU|nr:hypothetical protein GE061_014973 [Apolygus lucorum]
MMDRREDERFRRELALEAEIEEEEVRSNTGQHRSSVRTKDCVRNIIGSQGQTNQSNASSCRYQEARDEGRVGDGPQARERKISTNLQIANSSNNTVQEMKGLVARKKVPYELPIFEGDPAQWPYVRSTAMGQYSDDENLLRLQKALKDTAKECVGALLFLPGGLPKIIDRLKRRYGMPDSIAREVLSKLENVTKMGEEG